MVNKLFLFLGDILLAVVVGVAAFAFGSIFSTSMSVTCKYQQNETYDCAAHDTLLNYQLNEKQAEDVWKMEVGVKCSGSGKNRGCSHPAYFVTLAGDRVKLSSLYTSSESRSRQLAEDINSQMQTRAPVIQYDSGFSPWMIFSGCLGGFLFVAYILRAFLRFSPKSKFGNPIVINLRGKS